MPTYSKETALYDTGAIAAGIDAAGDTADTYITAVNNNGIRVHAANNPTTNYAGIDATGMDVVKGGTSVAKFGEAVRIGPSAGRSHVEVENNAFKLIAYPENQQYVNCSDSRNSSGYCTYNELIPYQGTSGRYPLSFEAVDTSTCTVRIYDDYSEARPLDPLHEHDHEVTNQYTVTKATTYIDVTPTLGENYGVYVSYRTTNPVAAKHYLFGIPSSTPMISGGMNVVTGRENAAMGICSFVEGEGNIAGGNYAHAEGYKTQANNEGAHTEGFYTIASGPGSHAEGNHGKATGECAHAEGFYAEASGRYSHAEGDNTVAGGRASHAEGAYNEINADYAHAEGRSCECGLGATYAHAEGYNTKANNTGAHSQNTGTIAASHSQTAMGKYNESDSNNVYALIIGNGTADNARSNALAVGWDGSVTTARDTLVTSTSNMSGIMTAASDITVDIFKFCQRSNVASILLRAKRSTATAANTAITVGTIVVGRRPPFECAGPGTSGVGDCWVDETGVVKFRSTSQIAANANFYVRITYPVA